MGITSTDESNDSRSDVSSYDPADDAFDEEAQVLLDPDTTESKPKRLSPKGAKASDRKSDEEEEPAWKTHLLNAFTVVGVFVIFYFVFDWLNGPPIDPVRYVQESPTMPFGPR